MTTPTTNNHTDSLKTPCSHSSAVVSIDVVTGNDKKLRRHACGLCRHNWWDSGGTVVHLTEALSAIKDAIRTPSPRVFQKSRPLVRQRVLALPEARPAPTAQTELDASSLVALLELVGQAIAADLVLFGSPGHAAWEITGAQATGRRSIPIDGGNAEPPALPSLSGQRLVSAIAQLSKPTELSTTSLTELCPGLPRIGIHRVVGAPVHDRSGALTGVIIAGYRAQPHLGTVSTLVAPETIACMGEPLATVSRRLPATLRHPEVTPAGPGTGPQSGLLADPDDLLHTHQVAALFAVSPRTINNWVAGGTLTASRTAGGHQRFRRGDVLSLREALRVGKHGPAAIGSKLAK